MRVLDGSNPSWVDKYGLNAYIYDSRDDGRTRYDRDPVEGAKSGDDAVAAVSALVRELAGATRRQRPI